MMGGEKTANEKRSTKLRAQLAAQFQSKIPSLLTTSLRRYLDSAAFGRSRNKPGPGFRTAISTPTFQPRGE